ncbi:DUF397 domain-containing protein [Streptomyces ossamyceticus]|uniref:DUF397 domain-containing protein n=1 Tax=Streptomyces ossamyceticus TaxID=249581 RepID=UPI0006E1CF06|nr:DUF397 domain-containing protein [Streptomyces ossamyceticus]
MADLNWQKSSFSGGPESNCLYLATAPDGTIRLRESDEPHVLLGTEPKALAALLGHVKASLTPTR